MQHPKYELLEETLENLDQFIAYKNSTFN